MVQPTVLFIAHDSSLFGSNKSLLNLIAGLSGKVAALVIIPERGKIAVALEEKNIKYHVVDYRYSSASISIRSFFMYPFLFIRNRSVNKRALKEIVELVKGHNVSIVHSNSSVITIGYDVANALGAKHVWHLREFQNLDHNLYPFAGFDPLIAKIKNSAVPICISRSIAAHFKLDPTKVVYNGVMKETEAISEDFEKHDYFLFCGVVKRSKGIKDAIEGFKEFIDKSGNKTSKLLIAGDVPSKLYEKYLRFLLGRMKLNDRVEFLGFQSDVKTLIKHALAILMCSKNEAMGRVTAEAMFLRCPVIGYNNMGTSELISDGETGLLYSTNSEMADKMAYIIENSGEAKKLALRAQSHAIKNYSQESYSRNISDIYSSLIGLPQISDSTIV